MSQEQLGLEAGVQRNFISLIELGQNQPTISTVFKLAKALRLPAANLVETTEELLTHGGPALAKATPRLMTGTPKRIACDDGTSA